MLREQKSQPTILIVDAAASCATMEQALTEAGFNVSIATNADAAFELYLEHLPELVISDAQMSLTNGRQLSAEIRTTRQGKYLPILMATQSGDADSIENCFSAGATDFMVKPIDCGVLPHRVRHMLQANKAPGNGRHTEEQLTRLGRVLDNSSKEIFFIDGETRRFSQLNHCALSNLGYRSDEVEGLHLTDLWSCSAGAAPVIELFSGLLDGRDKEARCEGAMLRKDGSSYAVEGHAYVSENELGTTDIVCILEDVTSRKEAEARMRQLAYYDSLTSLPNRQLFVENFKKMLAVGKRNNSLAALLFVDLDNFKYVNDTLGHNAGDELLRKISMVLLECVRESDVIGVRNDGDLARFGGDEFAILLGDINDKRDASVVAERMVEALSEPFIISSREIVTTPSIGIVLFPEHGTDVDLLLRKADIAMYEAKNRGRKGYQFYSDIIDAKGLEQMELERDFRRALDNGELVLHYQPQFDISSGEISGVEALVRWDRKGKGLVPPSVFIPLAEETNLIGEVGAWVLREACRQAREWRRNGVNNGAVSINLSSKQFQTQGLVQMISETLSEFGLSPECLDLEITETDVMENIGEALDILNALKTLGCGISLDDFGTGYSSLSYLHQFPIDVLKIDKSFIRDIHVGEESNGIISAIVALSKSMGLRVVAEGVETEEQLAFIRKHEVDFVQGFLWCKPLSAEEVTVMLLEHGQRQQAAP